MGWYRYMIFDYLFKITFTRLWINVQDNHYFTHILYGNLLRTIPLRWRHNERDGASSHQPYDCLLNRLFRHRSKKTSKLRVTGLCVGNSPGTGEFPAQMASYAENVSIWWRHHAILCPIGVVKFLTFLKYNLYTLCLMILDQFPRNTKKDDNMCGSILL